MAYAGEHVIAALKAARREKALSQRELSRRTGVPQSHISKIETGAVDIQLSSLIQIARVLGLEIMPVPRQLVPAVQTIRRSGESQALRQAENTRQQLKYLKRIRKHIDRLQAIPASRRVLLDLLRTARELEGFRIDSRELEAIRNISVSLAKIVDSSEAQQEIQRAANELRQLRNNLAHSTGERPASTRPAYTLEEEGNA